jgi:hypothetical protein
MTASKSFDRQNASRSSEEVDQAVRPAPAELIAAEESWALPYSLQMTRDDMPWQRPMNAAPRAQLMLGLQQHIGNRAVQRAIDRSRSTEPDAHLARRIQAASSGGSALDAATRDRLQTGLKADLSSVRIHTDDEADRLSHSIAALAFTSGRDIFFRSGAYDPTSSQGLHLLAHEATHTLQQSAGPVAGASTPGGVSISDPSDSFEQAAEQAAHDMLAGAAPAAQRTARGLSSAAYSGLHLSRASEVLYSAQSVAGSAQTQGIPADVNVGFNPMDILHKLLIAIDQSQVQFKFGASPEEMTRHVDFNAVVAALSNLTADQAKQVEAAYLAHENRTLYNDLFGVGESGFHSDLTHDQLMRIDALLGGTRARQGAAPEEAQAARAHQLDADAIELHQLLHGDREKNDVERVLAMIRRSKEANAELGAAYERHFNVPLSTDIYMLGIGHMYRANLLLEGKTVEADHFIVDIERQKIEEIDKKISELKEEASGWGASIAPIIEIKNLQKEREGLVEEIERQGQQAAAEGTAKAVLGDVNALATTVGGTDAAVIRAMVSEDPVAKVAAQLRHAADADKLDAAQLTAALRNLRVEAEERAQREFPKGDPRVEARAKGLAEDYFTRLRSSYNELAGDAKHFDELVEDVGNEGDVKLNKALVAEQGRLSDVDELMLALSGDRKDTESVERVLKYKSAAQIKDLKAQYFIRTGGHSLDYDLFGEAPTRAGEENPEMAGVYLKYQGKASGTSRLNLEDYMQRPDEEGGLAEVTYITQRAEREYSYTIENRGLTGAWRDAWGNEQRDLLDETIGEVRRLYWQWLREFGANPQFAHTPQSHDMIQQMRLARATIRGDRAAYEKATAELRATFQAIASFALQAALTAVIGPIAEFALIGELAEGASVALRVAKTVQTAAVGTSATIGANLAVYGSDYSLDMLKADLRGGMLGAIGPAAVDKMIGPYAKALANKLGPKASQEIIEAAKTVAGMETAAMGEGEFADLSPDSLAKALIMNKGAAAITKKVGGLVTGPKPPSETPVEHTTAESAPTETGAPASTTEAAAAAPAEAETGAPSTAHGPLEAAVPIAHPESTQLSPHEQATLAATADKPSDQISPEAARTEHEVADRLPAQPIDEPPFTKLRKLPNGHEVKETPEGDAWERCSIACAIYDKDGNLIAGSEPARQQRPHPDMPDVTVFKDPMEAAAAFAKLAVEVEQQLFSSGLAFEPGLPVRSGMEQQMAGAIGGGTPRIQVAGTSAAEWIQSRRGQAITHARETGGEALPRGFVPQQVGDVNVSELQSPTANQPQNRFVNWLGTYGEEGVMKGINNLRKGGLNDAQISQLMQAASVSGNPVTPEMLSEMGHTGTDRQLATQARYLTRLTHLIFRVEPLRFIDRGFSPEAVGHMPQPIATTTALTQQMVQSGAVGMEQVMGNNPPLGPATPEGIAASNVQITMGVEEVRKAWSAWKLSTEQTIMDEAKARGIADPHLVPTKEAILSLLQAFFGQARGGQT